LKTDLYLNITLGAVCIATGFQCHKLKVLETMQVHVDVPENKCDYDDVKNLQITQDTEHCHTNTDQKNLK
jgi:predicted GNAT family N-acyltransferase